MVLPLWTYLADVPRNPASTMKLVTTYAALELLGSQYRWNTVIASSAKVRHGVLKGNLYIKGSGDPKLSTDQFFEILSLLRAKGIKDIEGDIVLDRSWFIHPEVAAFNMTPEAAYQVLPDALLLNHQLLEVKAESDQKTVTLTLDPALPALTVKNNLVVDQTLFCANENIRRPLFIETLEGQLMIRFRGRFPAHCQKTRYYQVLDVERYINSLFTSLWQDLGGKWSGQIRLGEMPRRVKPLYVHYSPTLEKVLLDINKWSNNPMTRLVYLRLGQKQYASLARSEQSIRQWIKAKGWPNGSLILENGSGLSRNERVSARLLAQIVQDAMRRPFADVFISSLPIVGVDSTVKTRLVDHPIAGHAYIKTGTLANVSAIAGMIDGPNQQKVVIVAILNQDHLQGGREVLDSVLKEAWQIVVSYKL